MTDKLLATRLHASAEVRLENILFEVKSILETYLDKLNEDDTPEPDKVTETVRLLVHTVKYKHEQMIALNAEIAAYWHIVNNPLCTKGGKHAE